MGPGGRYGNQYIPPQPLAGPAPQQSPWQAQGYPPLPPSPSYHPSNPTSSGLPSPVRSRAPSPSPRHSYVPSPSPAPSSDYDTNWFNSKQEQRDYMRNQAIWRQDVENRKAKEALRYHRAGGNEPLDYDVNGNILPYLWNRLQTQQGVQQHPVVQPQGGPSGSQPRRSSHTRQPVVRPDNIYGNQNPIESEQMSNTGLID